MHLAPIAAEGFLVFGWLLALGWLWQAFSALQGMPTLPDLTQLPLPEPLPWTDGPDLTVVVPACNEEMAIAATLRSLLASRGIRLEILAVNDRSTDLTGEQMERVAVEAADAGGPHMLRILHIRALPEGWLGKPHAMAQAAAQAEAEWVLFTDGDVLFAPDALARALHHAQAERADHLVLTPTLIVHSLGERAMQAAMQVLAEWGLRLWKVADPHARDFIGVGGFNLFRREAYLAVGGFESLRMEVLDDLRIGWKIKRAGLRQRVALGPGLVSIRWIAGALSVIHLLEKNAFATYRFRPLVHVLVGFGLVLVALGPMAALLCGGWTSVAGAVSLLAIVLAYWAQRRLTQSPVWMAAFFGPCIALVTYAFMRSMVLALRRGGIRWRGTLYPLDGLRKQAGRW
jgi:glycosyltransferase involved in cell wall biosynthesis